MCPEIKGQKIFSEQLSQGKENNRSTTPRKKYSASALIKRTQQITFERQKKNLRQPKHKNTGQEKINQSTDPPRVWLGQSARENSNTRHRQNKKSNCPCNPHRRIGIQKTKPGKPEKQQKKRRSGKQKPGKKRNRTKI